MTLSILSSSFPHQIRLLELRAKNQTERCLYIRLIGRCIDSRTTFWLLLLWFANCGLQFLPASSASVWTTRPSLLLSLVNSCCFLEFLALRNVPPAHILLFFFIDPLRVALSPVFLSTIDPAGARIVDVIPLRYSVLFVYVLLPSFHTILFAHFSPILRVTGYSSLLYFGRWRNIQRIITKRKEKKKKE